MACLPQLGSVPAAYAVVAGGCDWPLPPAEGLTSNDVIALRPLRCLRCDALSWMETPLVVIYQCIIHSVNQP